MEGLTPEQLSFFNPDFLFDALIQDIRSRISEQGLDEILLPPSSEEFAKKKLGMLWKGTLILTNGKFVGLETIHREGEARISFSHAVTHNNQNVELTFAVDMGLSKPSVAYDFRVICMNREMNGVVTGTLVNLSFNIVISVNLATRKMRTVLFQFKDVGNIGMEVTGLGVVFNFLAAKATGTMVNRMKKEMIAEVEGQVETILTGLFNQTTWPSHDLPTFVVARSQAGFEDVN